MKKVTSKPGRRLLCSECLLAYSDVFLLLDWFEQTDTWCISGKRFTILDLSLYLTE